MKFLKLTALILAVILMAPCVSGCGKSHLDATIYFEVNEIPVTLDPQVASTDIELMVVRNIYEGLLRKSEDGHIENGVCQSYGVNDLTYTFNLRRDAKWSDGSPVSSYDFLYAFERAVNPKTKAPFVHRLFSIENAEAIYNGEKEVSSLGVEAPDEYTFVITLAREDRNFLNTLTTSICMPCNEEFFEGTVGKYGLERTAILSNGSYYIGKWNTEDFGIRLYKNKEYNGAFSAQNNAVFFSQREEGAFALLCEETADIAFIDNSLMDKASEEGLITISFQNICWVMTIGDDFTPDLKNAFASAVSSEVYESELISGFTAADTIYPAILSPDHLISKVGFTSYNINRSKRFISAAVKESGSTRFPKTTLYYYGDENIKPLVTSIAGHWQQNLSVFANIESSDNLSALQGELTSKTLPFAVFPIVCKTTDEKDYLSHFGISEGGNLGDIQTKILENKDIIPLAFENTNIVTNNLIKNISAECENGYIDFSFVIKEE